MFGPKTFKDHFSAGSADYAAHRPRYPLALAEELARISPGRALALDCACGTGQLSTLLARHFGAVVATDASPSQVANAEACERVTYRTVLAQESGLPGASADLITVAQAAHWLELEKFYEEVRRVARPQAVVALIAYGVLHVDGPADPIMQRFYSETVGPYWPPERRHVEEAYRNLPFPFREVSLPMMQIEVQWMLQDLVGYVGTWSALTEARKALGADPLADFEEELRRAWGDPEGRRRVTWPLAVRAGIVESC